MNQLIPKYSFMKLFIPHVKKYNVNTYINHHIQRHNEMFNINNMNVNMDIVFREDYNSNIKNNITNSNFIKTELRLFFDNKSIDELIKINYSDNHFKIDYELKNNNKLVEKIDIPKFKVENNNYNILLEHYKFIDSSHEKYYKLFTDIQNKL